MQATAEAAQAGAGERCKHDSRHILERQCTWSASREYGLNTNFRTKAEPKAAEMAVMDELAEGAMDQVAQAEVV